MGHSPNGSKLATESNIERGRLALDAFKARAQAYVDVLDAEGRFLNAQMDAILKAIQGARDIVKLKAEKIRLRQLRIKVSSLSQQRRRAQQQQRVVRRQLNHLRKIYAPGGGATQLGMAKAAYRYFYRIASPTARREADACSELPQAVDCLIVEAVSQQQAYVKQIESIISQEIQESG